MPEPDAANDAQVDRQLMRQLRDGDRAALERLYKRHSRLVLALIVRVLRDRHESEDVLEDVFFELWRSTDRFDDSRGSVRAYLVTLARSRAIDRLRRRDGSTGKRSTMQYVGDDRRDTLNAASETPADVVDLGEQRAEVRKALEGLDPETRSLIERSFYDGQSHTDIAEALGKPLGTVKTQIRRGLFLLAKALKTVKSILF